MPDLIALLTDKAPDLTKIPDAPLGDPTVGPDLPALSLPQPLSYETPELAGLTFVASPEAQLTLRVFNSLDDADPDGVLLPGGKEAGGLVLSADGAWIRTGLEVAVKAGGGGSVRDLGFELDTRSSLSLLHYRRHGRQDNTRRAVLNQLLGARTALRFADVAALQPGEAVALRLGARLQARVEVSWADVIAGNLSHLAQLLNAGEVLPVRISVGGTANVNASVEGEFMIVFTRVSEGVCSVSVRKAAGTSLGAGAELKVGAELADPGAVGEVVNAVLEGLLRKPLAKVMALLESASEAALTAEQLTELTGLARTLRIDAVQDRLSALRERIRQLESQVETEVKKAAAIRVSVGFGYEYSRISERTSLLTVDLPTAELGNFHGQLLQGKTAALTAAAARPGSSIVVLQDMGGKVEKTKRSWGFALNVAKWRASGRDRREVTAVEERLGTELRRSHTGLGGYSARVGGEAWEWVVDFNASMRAFSPRPLVSEYECGLSLSWEAQRDRLSKDDLRQALDIGVLWGALPQTEIDEVMAGLQRALGHSVSIETGLRIDPEPFARMLPHLAALDDDGFGDALAAAMPWRDQSGRQSPAERRAAYAPLWRHYLGSPGASPSQYAVIADRYFTFQYKAPSLRGLELSGAARNQTFCGLIELNPKTAEGWQAFRAGMRRLHEARTRADADTGVIAAVYRQVSQIWRQSHHVHALGDLLLQCAARAGVAEQIERTVGVTIDGREVELLTS